MMIFADCRGKMSPVNVVAIVGEEEGIMRVDSIHVIAAAALLATLGVSTAAAQSGAPPSAQQAAGGAIGRLTPEQQISRFENEEQRRRLSLSPEEAEAEYGVERMELARQVAELVEQGKCREARALANEAGERQMAIRVRQTCRSR